MDIRWKAITAVMVLILLVCSIFLTLFIRHGHIAIERIISSKEKSARILAQRIFTETQTHYQKRIKSFVAYENNKQKSALISAFAHRDREKLLAHSQPFLKILKGENNFFSSIGWVLPDNHNFLRVHKPENFGDDVSVFRPDIAEANGTRRPVSGFMVGPSGMEYRVVQPVFYEGDFLGVTQFGIKASLFMDSLSEKLNSITGLAVLTEECRKAVFAQIPFQQCGDYTIRTRDITLFKKISDSLDLSQDIQRKKIDGRHYTFISPFHLNNFQNRALGKIIVALDITEELKDLRTLIISSLILSLGLLILSFTILDFSFGSLLNKIISLNESLIASNESLTRAKEEVEKIVQERTEELVTANRNLEQEITERQQAEKEKSNLENRLRQAQKMEAIGTLAGGIAHDFNNILGAILGYTELSLLDSPESSNTTSNLMQIKKAGNRAKDLVAQILTFSRSSEARKLPMRISPVIKETLKLLRSTLPSTIEIATALNANDALVSGDPSQVHQLIMNLSTNAAQAMGSEYGKLTISLKGKNIQHSKESGYPHLKPGNYVELIVADTGQGITHEDKERIFEPFFTTKDVGEGTGLGLAVVHGIVENMQGDVSVESTHGVGSAFRVLLPLVVDVPQEMENNVVNTPIPVGKEKILLVDDEEELVKLGDQLLSNLGYQVRTVTNSQEALEIFTHNQNFDLVITDQTMPNLTGMELAKKILEMRPDIPILLCTGYSTEITDEKIREIGIRSVLMKPISIGDVSRVIRKELDGGN